MYHGEDSGHFILFVNGDIIQIDFGQLEHKTYNFLVENQLLELALSPVESSFEYVLTPQRPNGVEDVERTFDKHFWIPLILLLLILNLAFYYYKYKSGLGIG